MIETYITPQLLIAELESAQCFAQSDPGSIRPWEDMGEVNEDLNF